MAANPEFENPQSGSPQLELTQSQVDERIEWRAGELALPETFALESGEILRNGRLAWQCVGPAQAALVVVLGGISGPHGNANFPAIAASDQARALLLLLNRLGVRHVHLIVGASYGGAVAQHLAALLGERLRRLVLLSAAHRSSQFALALRHVQRAILELGGDTHAALALARSLAVLGYRTPEGVEARFTDADADSVVGWLAHHGERFAQRFDATAYRCLGASLDGHVIDPASISAPTLLLGVREDLLIPISLLREYAGRCGEQCRLLEISSVYGHDAFLKEEAAIGALLSEALEAAA